VGVSGRFARKLTWRPDRGRRAKAMPSAAPAPPEVTYSLGLDIGEIAAGYHLIVRGISLPLSDYVLAGGPARVVRFLPA
jgi:hypothetical protein